MDNTDKKILKILTSDARLSARHIAIKLGLSTVTVLSRIKKMEKSKMIKGYTAELNHEKLGYDLTAIIEVTAKKERLADIEKKLSSFDNLCAVYDITGTSDIIAIGKFKNRGQISKFVKEISSIPDIENTNTHIVLNTVKETFELT